MELYFSQRLFRYLSLIFIDILHFTFIIIIIIILDGPIAKARVVKLATCLDTAVLRRAMFSANLITSGKLATF